MGWYGSYYTVEEIKAELFSSRKENGVQWHCLAHTRRGNTLWAVLQRVLPTGEEFRWIECIRLRRHHKGAWAYKPIDESMGPYYFDCPLKFFVLVPEGDPRSMTVNPEWRKAVHALAAKRTYKARVRRAAKRHPCKFCGGLIVSEGHHHQGGRVCDACWDERLRVTA